MFQEQRLTSTRGVFSARNFGNPAQSTMIDYVTIATLGNAIRFW